MSSRASDGVRSTLIVTFIAGKSYAEISANVGSRLPELPFGAAQAGSKFGQAFPQPVPDDFRCIGGRPGC